MLQVFNKKGRDAMDKEQKIPIKWHVIYMITFTVFIIIAPLAIMPDKYVENLLSFEGMLAYAIAFLIVLFLIVLGVILAFKPK